MAFQLRLWVVAMSLAFSAGAMAAPEAALAETVLSPFCAGYDGATSWRVLPP